VFPLNLYARVRFFVQFAHETAGAARTRSSLRPLFSKGGMLMEKLAPIMRRDREAMFGKRKCRNELIRHCERSEAIHSFFAAAWIASLRSQ